MAELIDIMPPLVPNAAVLNESLFAWSFVTLLLLACLLFWLLTRTAQWQLWRQLQQWPTAKNDGLQPSDLWQLVDLLQQWQRLLPINKPVLNKSMQTISLMAAQKAPLQPQQIEQATALVKQMKCWYWRLWFSVYWQQATALKTRLWSAVVKFAASKRQGRTDE